MPFLLDLFVKGLMAFGTTLLTRLCSKAMIEWAFFKIAQSVVETTKTPHDDEWLEKIREVYFEGDKDA